MRKITLCFLLFICFSFLTTAQNKEALNKNSTTVLSSTNAQNSNGLGLQLNQENQNFYNQNGVIRCLTEEVNESYRLSNPNRQSKDEFENWLAPLLQEHKQRVAQQKSNGTFVQAVVEIPIIFHVVSGSPGDAADLDAIYVNAQIDQLNLDFGNQAGGATGPWAAVAADAQIVFVPAQIDPNGNPLAEPGINRVYGYPGQLARTTFDSTIKPATIWDRTKYCNNWTGNLGGGLLGYAQFPDNSTLPGMPGGAGGSTQTDGVVCLYSSIGSIATPHPQGGVYAAGRTLTHEIGHWIGLRHIWGDGGCNVDDFCADTPAQGTSSAGCPTTQDSCAGGGRDMVENFMDYSYDTCMNLFTADQVARMAVVLANSPGRQELPNSNTGATSPVVSFANSLLSASESTDCSFTDYTVSLSIASGASQNTTANLSVNGGTATSGTDYLLINNSVTFAAGSTANQNVTVRVFNDGFVEGNETLDLTFTLNVNGGDATVGNNNLTFTINDDDSVPINTQTVTLINSDVEATDTTPWFIIDNDGDTRNFAGASGLTYPGITGDFFYSASNGSALGTPGNYTPDNFLLSDAIVIPNGATNVSLSFGIGGFQDSEPYRVYWTTDDTSVATIIGGTTGTQIASGNTLDGGGQVITINMDAFSGQTGYLAFRHLSPGTNPGNGRTDGLLLVDNILLEATTAKFIQTAVNENTSAYEVNLAGSGTIYTSDLSTTDLMLDITNNTGNDYGCVNVSVNRSGNSTQTYNGSTGTNLVLDKTFKISTTNSPASGNLSVDFYITAAEMNGFTSTTGLTSNDLFAYREGSNDLVALTTSAFGSDFKLTGNFTDLSGTYYLGAEGAFRLRISPKMFLSGPTFSAGLMSDALRSGGYLPTTSPYTDGLTVNATVFNTTGANAIVDWVWLELRDAATNTTISASRSALLQRDGDVVDVDGTSPVLINVTGKNYFVVVNHRNHLGAMSLNTIALSGTATTVDFTNGSVSTFGTNAQKDMGSGVFGLWAGDLNGDNVIRFAGPNNDTNILKTTIVNHPSNTTGSVFFPYNAYDNFDLDMNGQVRFGGPGNDSNILKSIISNFPGNTTGSVFYPINQQLP
ncbi:M43 family zinc metalloprotease [Aurantibacter aestuarii]|uniref:Peptidase M43 pregnancy-associated plasma-A domain-containing protein n=1 Tax=Aurantibacter aestuarii TaxID=1266046 RepID=A0A2T1NE36_9FLAO|nr:M43 family zinc metalloprotease [Aurantibacter aestuarii]PSG90708.1 hypothetical protein C7H52_05365 [Aurantibacter aestuarii]